MPLVRLTRSVSAADLPGRRGAEVHLSPARAQQVVANGWGVIVRGEAPESPEARATEPEKATTARRTTRRRKSPAGE